MLTSLCLAFFAIGGDDPILDIVELGNGKKLEGIILQVTDDEIILAQGSRNKSIPREKVSNLSGPRQEYPNYILKLQGLLSSSPSATEVLDLADWCMEHGLPWDANALQHFALVIDPGNEKAHLALGHKKFKDSWKAKLKSGNRIRWESIQEKRLEFSNAWEFKTAHFEVRAAGPLKDTLLACFELEQFYSLFYSLFQKQVGFHELQNPIKVFIYPNLSEFPPQSGIEGAYFDPNNRVLHTFFDEAVAKSLLHEATHALLFYSGRELERRDPEFPGWLDEGLACYLEAGLGNTPGLVEFDESIIAMHRFQAHRDAGRNMDGLTRVLNYQKSDFWASTGRVRRYAQSYTLVRFLLFSGDDELRENFFRYLSSTYRSKGSTTYFKKIFGKKVFKKIETNWRDWVLETAGPAH